MKKIDVTTPNCRPRFEEWIKTRGGVLSWPCIDLSNPGAGMIFTPATTPEGEESKLHKPHWNRGAPTLHTSLDDFRFCTGMREVQRFHVALRMGAQGMKVKLTDGSTRKLEKACEKAGPDSRYHFDYDTQEAVIELPTWEDDHVDQAAS